jgi:hypothetical protein
MNNHTNFILKPIANVLKDAITASAGIGNGIETYPLCDYIFQSTFLKMTGFQEQKMKCICWEMASNDYEYRYKRYSQNPLGECSCIEEKNKVYSDLINQITKRNPTFDIQSTINKQELLLEIKTEIATLFDHTNWSIWLQNDYNKYKDIVQEFEGNCFIGGKKLFVKCENCNKNGKNHSIPKCANALNLESIYDKLYIHRNQCAHNTLSYQQNLPTLTTLAKDDYKYNNYFVYFFLLILIDKIVIYLYENYLNVLRNSI